MSSFLSKFKEFLSSKSFKKRALSAIAMVILFFTVLYIGAEAMKVAFIVLISIMVWEMETMFKKKKQSYKKEMPIDDLKKFSFYKIGFMFLLFYPTLRLFALLSSNYDLALFLIFLTLFVAVATDVGAFFVGCNLKTMKPFPNISPNKSLGGYIGGWMFGFVFGLVYLLIMGGEFVSWSLETKILIMLIAPIVAMIGDLFESLVKRFCEVKDSSDLIPGHGGLWDRLDSFLLTLLFFEILVL